MAARGWQFWIDRGGTFTDVVARRPDQGLITRKLLSENPARYSDAAVAGICGILADSGESQPVIDAIKMGTTVATNALLERRGEPTVLVTTQGFGDALNIGYQTRPELFALNIRKSAVLHTAVVEAEERVTAEGEVLQPLDESALRDALATMFRQGYRAVAVCLLHGYRHPAHERSAGRIARELGFEQVSLSHETSPLIRLISRGDTTVADAYLSPVLYRYTQQLRKALRDAGLEPARLLYMQSNGGLVDGQAFRGKDSILSGPAGGVAGMISACRGLGTDRLIGFDMGGTSTDVSLHAGTQELVDETELDGIRLRAPMIRIHSVAAGGGSMLKFENGRFQVGPESAGAQPGPMSYGRGGPLTVTDANLMLGRLLPEHFPAVFGPGGNQPLDRRPVEVAFAELALQIQASGGGDMSAETVAEGFIRVANDNMANAIKTVSIHRGYNPENFSLCCFGGAGGQHACQVAEALGLGRVILHPLAGVLSAYGMGMAPLRAYRQATADLLLNQESEAPLRAQLATLADTCLHDLREQGAETDRATVDSILNIRIPGSDTSLPVPWQGSIAAARQAFHDLHARQFGFSAAASELWVETLRVDATVADGDDWPRTTELPATQTTTPTKARVFCAGIWRDAPVCFRSALPQEEWLDGPMIVVDPGSTTVVEPGWAVLVDAEGRLQLRRQFSADREDSQSDSADPILLEIFNSHFMNVAEQMGAVLENTAHSVNIKERKDFSCALFDHAGRLIANAPHIPVHLGSMGESVRSVLETGGLQPGDSWMLNDPYRGGTHLPDITVVTPVFDSTGDCIQFVVACRAHHADIGGISPGSMPAFSRTIGEEGICFEPFRLVSGGCLREADLRHRLGDGDWPARNPDQNIADLRAQLAANEKGVQQIAAMVSSFGLQQVQAYMQHVRNNAAESVRRALAGLREGECQRELDGGERISVRLQIDQQNRTARLDFSASSPQSAGNLNAPPGITRAVVLYVFRCLLPGRIPLNEGCLEPLEIQIPEDSILNPRPPAAVAAGNVETSQCVADALLGALGVLAGSQGTMNNLSFGDGRYQYYETICGGAGAGPDFAGTDAVHTHMTNSRITDAEILESRYPVLLREFSIRPESGGRGRHDGGNGVVRAIEFRASMHAEIVSSRRLKGPPGMAGGNSGKPGVNLLVHASGEVETLPGIARTEVEPGDMLIIATPGGGGYGPIPQ